MTQEKTNFDVYELHNKSLRTWFVAYGVGGPIFLFNKPEMWESLANSSYRLLVIFLFLGSTLFQVGVVFINKWIMYYQHRGDTEEEFKETRCYKISEKISKYAWIDISADVFSICALSAGTALTYLSITT
jgi:hypothetical protein